MSIGVIRESHGYWLGHIWGHQSDPFHRHRGLAGLIQAEDIEDKDRLPSIEVLLKLVTTHGSQRAASPGPPGASHALGAELSSASARNPASINSEGMITNLDDCPRNAGRVGSLDSLQIAEEKVGTRFGIDPFHCLNDRDTFSQLSSQLTRRPRRRPLPHSGPHGS